MDRKNKNLQSSIGKWMMSSCNSSAFNHWLTHSKNLWSSCIATYHYNWSLKLSKNKEFVEVSFKIINKLIEKIEKDCNNYGLDNCCKDYNVFIEKLKERVDTLHNKFTEDEISFANKDIYVENWK